MASNVSLVIHEGKAEGYNFLLACSEHVNMILLSPETNLKPDKVSPKERRKLRNERREELKEKKGSWREEVESKLDVKKKPPKGWEEILDIDRLATKGYQWWMLSVPKNNEKKAADQLNIIFPERFPRLKYEVRPMYSYFRYYYVDF